MNLFFVVLLFCLSPFGLCGENTHQPYKIWANWLGPNHNGSLDGVELATPPKNKEYKIIWQKKIGEGWSSPVVDNSSVFLHDRVGEQENVQSFDRLTGAENWSYSYRSGYRDDFGMINGPRSTPAVGKDVMISHGPQGLVHAFAKKSGKCLWTRDLKKDFSSPKGFFGRCSSPLIFKNTVIFDTGGPNAGLVALSLEDGKTCWVSEPHGNDYSSPVPFFYGADQLCIAFMRDGFLATEISSGKKRFFTPFRSRIDASVNAASPLVLGNKVFLSSCYGVGAGLWSWQSLSGDAPFSFVNLWKKEGVMDCHYSTPVAHNGYIYGYHGRQERGPVLRCIRSSDGQMAWEKSSIGTGNLIRIGGKILTLTDRGEMIVFSASPKSFNELHRQQILGTGGRSHFAVAHGLLFARDQRRLICLDLNTFF